MNNEGEPRFDCLLVLPLSSATGAGITKCPELFERVGCCDNHIGGWVNVDVVSFCSVSRIPDMKMFWANLTEQVGMWVCRHLHRKITVPVRGKYTCLHCLREYDFPKPAIGAGVDFTPRVKEVCQQ